MKPSPGPWAYDVVTEEVKDVNGEQIGRFEPVSGPLAAGAWELHAAAVEIEAAITLVVDAKGADRLLKNIRAAIAKATTTA